MVIFEIRLTSLVLVNIHARHVVTLDSALDLTRAIADYVVGQCCIVRWLGIGMRVSTSTFLTHSFKDCDVQPIFKVAEYGLFADLFTAIPKLTEKLP